MNISTNKAEKLVSLEVIELIYLHAGKHINASSKLVFSFKLLF